MSFQFSHTAYLWGILLLPVVWLSCRRSLAEKSLFQKRLASLIRVAAVLLTLSAIAGLSVTTISPKEQILFLIDESESIDPSAVGKAENYVENVKKTESESSDSSGKIDAKQKTSLNQGEKCLYKTVYFSETPRFELSNRLKMSSVHETNIEKALRTAVAAADPECQTKLVLFSDGNETRGEAIAAALDSPLPIFTVPLDVSSKPEVQLSDLKYQEPVRRGEAFRVAALVRSNHPCSGTLSLFQNGYRLETKTISIEKGENKYLFDAAANDRTIELLASVETKSDTILENNSRREVIQTEGEPEILLIDQNPDTVRDFVQAMREQKINIEVRSSLGIPQKLNDLEKYDAVILSDVSAKDISRPQMEALNEYVRSLGGGLLMFGGENAFGLGDYQKSPLADILPVRTEFENEEDKAGIALCLAVDRSGSMDGDKMMLTQDAVRAVIELLSPRDELSLIAFDMIAHRIIPLQNVTAPSALIQTVGSMTAEGGTNIYAALDEACREMSNSDAKYKHIILLTDGKSESADYNSIIRRVKDAKITLSTIGIGDCDRDLLENLARDGNGRFYACENVQSVPQIFMHETSEARRSSLSETPTFPVPESIFPILDQIDISNAPQLLGNVVTKAKPSSEVHLTTEMGDPLLISWRYGLGISLAFTSDVKGRWSAEWLDWPGFSRFWARILRYTIKSRENSNIVLSIKSFDDGASVTLDAKNSSGEFINQADVHLSLLESSKMVSEITMEQTAPGRYNAHFSDLSPGRYTVRTVISQDGETISTDIRGFVVEENRENDVKPVDENLLRQISAASNGIYNPSPEEILTGENLRSARKIIPCWPWLLTAALLLFTLEIILRRFDIFENKSISEKSASFLELGRLR